ncbi:MAG TPA: hypothetical protein VIU61_25595 [Kofleriaceae bacterium]
MIRLVSVFLMLAACSKAPSGKPAEIIDLSGSMADLATAFDAKRGEVRFVALLSPT